MFNREAQLALFKLHSLFCEGHALISRENIIFEKLLI